MRSACRAGTVLLVVAVTACASVPERPDQTSSINARLGGRPTTPEDLMAVEGQAMRGEFSYMADAGSFRDCESGERYPVAHEGDNAALERAYLTAVSEPGAPLVVTLRGHPAKRDAIDRNGTEEFLIVDEFESVQPGPDCRGEVAAAPLIGSYWRLTEYMADDGMVQANADLRAHIMLHEEENRLSGSGGCNRLIGSYELNHDGLSLGQVGSTMMACPPEAMQQEQAFVAALGLVIGYRIEGEALTLTGAAGDLARFERWLE